MASPVFPAKEAVLALLETVLPGDVRWGLPSEGEDYSQSGELLFLAEVPSDGEINVLGANRIDHTFTLRIVIDVRQPGDDERLAEQRAFELRDQIVPLIVADSTLAGTVSHIEAIDEPVAGNRGVPGEWRAQRVIDIACAAYEHFT